MSPHMSSSWSDYALNLYHKIEKMTTCVLADVGWHVHTVPDYRPRLQTTVGRNCSSSPASGYSSSALDENEVPIDDDGVCFCGELEYEGYELSSDLDFEKRKDLIRIDV